MMVTTECLVKDPQAREALREFNQLFGRLERRLYVDHFVKGKRLPELKSHYIKTYQISARHFNSLSNQLGGKVAAQLELAKEALKIKEGQVAATVKTIRELDEKIKKKKSQVKDLLTHREKVREWRVSAPKKKKPKLKKALQGLLLSSLRKEIIDLSHKRHQKKRRLAILQTRVSRLTERLTKPKLCFGSKELLRQQHHLKKNNYASHQAWLKDWQFHRSHVSYWLGSHEETRRNQNAQFHPAKKTLVLRLPQCLNEKFGSSLTIQGIEFAYLGEELADAILHKRQVFNKKQRKWVEQHVPVSYRFIWRKNKQDEEKLYLQASFELRPKELTSRSSLGAIGIDLNADHIAVCETDRFGNPISKASLPFVMKDKSSEQIEAQFGDHIAEIVGLAEKTGKVIFCETLDFTAKKKALREQKSKAYRQMLSSFAYKKFFTMLLSRAARVGVKVKDVNPAFTSVIGFYKFQGYRSYSSHELAALAIARRGLHFSERVRTKTTLAGTASILDPGEVALFFREKQVKHSWSWWARHTKLIRPLMGTSSPGRITALAYNPLHPSGYHLVKSRGLLRLSEAVTSLSQGKSQEKSTGLTDCSPVARATAARSFSLHG